MWGSQTKYDLAQLFCQEHIRILLWRTSNPNDAVAESFLKTKSDLSSMFSMVDFIRKLSTKKIFLSSKKSYGSGEVRTFAGSFHLLPVVGSIRFHRHSNRKGLNFQVRKRNFRKRVRLTVWWTFKKWSRDKGNFFSFWGFIVFHQFQALLDIGERCPIYQTTRLDVHFRLRYQSNRFAHAWSP